MAPERPPTPVASRTVGVLSPYVPRLVVDWLRTTPADSHRVIDGTLAFLDISGFTRLTERLARKGKVGAEEMSDALSATFAELLSVAYADGADLVKWGGDAILLLFDGDEHAARACQAAHEMRQVLRERGVRDKSSGGVTLRVSVGVHSGPLHFFLVGDPTMHRELLVCGPASTRTVAMESAAAAGQICVSPETAALLHPSLVKSGPHGSFLLRARPGARPYAAPAVRHGLSDNELAQVVPSALREHLGQGAGEAEHRPVAVGFVRFSGTDSVFAQSGPNGLAVALDECVRNVQHACATHGVTFFESDVDHDGGKIMLTAGAPLSSGHDEENLLRAARLIVERPGTLPRQVGVNHGYVFAGDFGPPFRRTYSVKGDAVNLAARVMARAEPGLVIATNALMKRSQARFETRELVPFSVKGMAAEVHAVVLGPATGTRDEDLADLLLIGRDAEMDQLTSCLTDASAGQGRLVGIVGEAGIGKTRLATEVLTRATGVTVLRVTCDEYESAVAYSAFRTLLRGMLGIPRAAEADHAREVLADQVTAHAQALLPWLPLLGIPLDIPFPSTRQTAQLEEQFRKSRLEEVTCEFLLRSQRTPTVFCFENAHLMDEASADLLHALAPHIATMPWLVLLTRRDEARGFVPGEDSPTVTLRLGPLPPASAVVLAEIATEDAPMPPQVMDMLAARAGGNPLFLRELARAASRSGQLDGLPDSLEQLVTHEIDELAPQDRTVLRYAAVLGVRFETDMLRQMLPAELRGQSIEQRLRGFLHEDRPRELRFRHPLLRDVAYEGLAYRRRRDLHARAGETIERSLPDPEAAPEQLAWHYFHAARYDHAWRFSRLAGDRARAKFAHAEAAEFYQRAVDSARRADGAAADDQLADVLESLGDVRYLVGQATEAADAYKAARRQLEHQPVRAAQLILKEARLQQRLGHYPQALRWISRGFKVLGGLDDDTARATRSMLATRHAVCRVSQGRYRDAGRWGRVAAREAEAAGDRMALAQAYLALHTVELWSAEHGEMPYGERALALFVELDDAAGQAHCENNLAMRALFEGHWTEALDMFGRAAESFRLVGDATNAANAAYNQADVMIRQGRLAEAEPVLADAQRVARAVGDEELVALCLRESGRASARAGRHDDGMARFAEARRRFMELGEPHEVVDTDAAIAECLLLHGDWNQAHETATDALARATSLGAAQIVPTLRRIRGVALMQAGQVDDAHDELTEGLRHSEAPDVAHERGFLLAALADVARLRGDPSADQLAADGELVLAGLGVVTRPMPPTATDGSPARR